MVLIGVILAGLVAASFHVALHRLYQVDELENAYCARILALGKQKQFMTSVSLFILPFMVFARAALSSAELMDRYRVIFFAVMWINVWLLARATRIRLMTPLGACVLLLAATLPPLWDYGYEVRHDNLLLMGSLVLWCLGKPAGVARRYTYVLLGALAVTLQFTAFKAFLYWVPLSGALLVFPHPAHRAQHSRLLLIGQWLAGAALALGCFYALYQALHLWDLYVSSTFGGVATSAAVKRASHMDSITHLLRQAPLLIAAPFSVLFLVLQGLRSQGLRYISWAGAVPELLLALGALGIFFVNPTPFRYNLVPLSGLLLVAGLRVLSDVGPALQNGALGAALVAVMVGCQLVPSAISGYRLFALTNDRQHTVTALAETMTDPEKDRVYAASGLVLTRDSVGYAWFLHTLLMKRFYDGTYPTVRATLAKQPASVFIPSYRTDWLHPSDRMYIAGHYLPLADDFWVLGQVLPSGGGVFECQHAGRYAITHGRDAQLVVDDQPLDASDVREFTRGTHHVESSTRFPTTMRWLGPNLKALPALPPGNHSTLFNGDF